jgi:lipid A 3-O-deacylase
MANNCIKSALVGVALLVSAYPALAQDDTQTDDAQQADKTDKEVGTFSFQLENDLFSGTDRHYTSGIRFSWLSPEGETIEPLAAVHDVLESTVLDLLGPNGVEREIRYGVSFGQDMYTPEDRATSALVVDDRPYAAWLYGAASLHTIKYVGDTGNRQPTRLDSVELQLGVVGSAAQGEETQDAVHDIRLIETFNGWDNQLRNEPGMLLLYERKWRFGKPVPLSMGEFDMIHRAGGSIGNVLTHANMGGVARWGWNLPQDFGPANLIQGGAPFLDTNRNALEIFGGYFFLSAEGRLVAHNIFLDGNTFRDSHSVDKKHLVGDLTMGATAMIGPVNLTYSNTVRSREFEGQNSASHFGALTISFEAAF